MRGLGVALAALVKLQANQAMGEEGFMARQMTRPHVLIARLDCDGDILLSGPAVRAVSCGASRVTLLCGSRGRAAARLLPGVDEIIVHHAAWIDGEQEPVDRNGTLALVDEIAALDIDQAVILTSFHQSPLPTALLLRLAGIQAIAAISVDYPGSLLDVCHHVSDDIHEVERSLSLVATLGYQLPSGDDGRLSVKRPCAMMQPLVDPGPYVVVHPGASAPARAWEPELGATLVRELANRGYNVVVTGSETETELTAFVAGGTKGAIDLGGKTDIATLTEVLARADTVVVGNTGPAHLAAALGTPIVSLFAPTVPAVRWRPWGVPCELLGIQHIACAGCRARVCPVAGHPCLSRVPVRAVVSATERLALPAHRSRMQRVNERPVTRIAATPRKSAA